MRQQTPQVATEEEPEIEVVEGASTPAFANPQRVAHGTDPLRNPRQKRNPADDVIESGEIVERRSLIIRSANNLPVFEEPEPTEISAMPFVEMPRSRWYRVWLVVAVLAGAGAGVAAYLGSRGTSVPNLDAAMTTLGATLDSERQATYVRAEAIATSSMLRAGIETDAATLSDMARDKDVVFPLEAGQILEVVQIRGGQRTVLLRLPAEATALTAPTAGKTSLELREGVLGVVANAPVPKQASGISGEIVMWTPVELARIVDRLPSEIDGAVLEGFAQPVELVAPRSATNTRYPIKTELATPQPLALATFIAPADTTQFTLVRNGCAVAAGASLLLFAAFAARARRRA